MGLKTYLEYLQKEDVYGPTISKMFDFFLFELRNTIFTAFLLFCGFFFYLTSNFIILQHL